MRNQIRHLQSFVNRSWYAPLLGLLAAADNFLLVLPTDGILISSCMLSPRKWAGFALAIGIGSTLGAIVLAAVVDWQGLEFIQWLFPELLSSEAFLKTQDFFNEYGLWVVFLVAISPFFQQPAVILAALAQTPLLSLLGVVLVGRVLKFLFMAYVGSHFPKFLAKLWGLRGELEEAGVQISDTPGNPTVRPPRPESSPAGGMSKSKEF